MKNKLFIFFVLLLVGVIQSKAQQIVKDTISYQKFVGYDHELKGAAMIYKDNDGKLFIDLIDMYMTEAPDAKLYLSKTDTYSKSKVVKLADLKSVFDNETTTYELPDDIELKKFESVIIWCYQYHVLFGNAKIVLK